jgi:DNA (cytosine-5)-methyltransferase 1
VNGPLRILDLFCGAGGAAWGYHLAFPDAEIVGVDIVPQPRYPFTFVQSDALTFPLAGFDFIHASPPCQGYSVTRHLPWLKGKDYPRLIAAVRERLVAAGVPYVIENVEGAAWEREISGGWLCGGMFGKRYYRHRRFESSFFWMAPGHPRHRATIKHGRMFGERGRAIGDDGPRRRPGHFGLAQWSDAAVMAGGGVAAGHNGGTVAARAEMECPWMSRDELTQAIPPAYTRYLAQFIPEP